MTAAEWFMDVCRQAIVNPRCKRTWTAHDDAQYAAFRERIAEIAGTVGKALIDYDLCKPAGGGDVTTHTSGVLLYIMANAAVLRRVPELRPAVRAIELSRKYAIAYMRIQDDLTTGEKEKRVAVQKEYEAMRNRQLSLFSGADNPPF